MFYDFFAACDSIHYGDGCSKTCTCENGAECDDVTGDCACIPGFMNANCSEGSLLILLLFAFCDDFAHFIECKEGFYGDCQKKCTCKNGADCDKGNGTCTCKPGFNGNNCQNRKQNQSAGKSLCSKALKFLHLRRCLV